MDDIRINFADWLSLSSTPYLNHEEENNIEENNMNFDGLPKKRIRDMTREELNKVISVQTTKRYRDVWSGSWNTDYETHFLLGNNYVCSYRDYSPTDSRTLFFKLYVDWTKCSKYARLNERGE